MCPKSGLSPRFVHSDSVCEKPGMGLRLRLSKVGNIPGWPGQRGFLWEMGPWPQISISPVYPWNPISVLPPWEQQLWIQGPPPGAPMLLHLPPSPLHGQGLTTARLTQAVASWVRVASSSWSCIFFSSFLGVEERGGRQQSDMAGAPQHTPVPCSWDAHTCWLMVSGPATPPHLRLRHASSTTLKKPTQHLHHRGKLRHGHRHPAILQGKAGKDGVSCNGPE